MVLGGCRSFHVLVLTTYQLNIIELTLLLGKSSCNYTFPVTETTLKFNYLEKSAWIGGTIGIIGDNSKVMNTIESVLGLPQRLRWHTRMDWSFFPLVYRIFKTSETMLSNRSNLPLCLVSMFNTSPISTKCDITVLTRKLLRYIMPLEENWPKLFTALIRVMFQINTHFTHLFGKRCWNFTILLWQKPFWSFNIQENQL